jgi:SOS response regulatory protein OraA/RecX
VRLDIRRTGTIKKGDEAIGNETKVKVVKNKVSPPFKTAEFDIMFGQGISREGEIIDMGVNANILDKSGAWYAYNGEKIGQGRDNAREFLRENPDLSREIENKVRASLGIPLLGGADAPDAPAKVSSKKATALLNRSPTAILFVAVCSHLKYAGPFGGCLGLMVFSQPSLKGRALRLLSTREYSRLELERKLAPFEEQPGSLALVLDDLQTKGFICEQRVLDSVVNRRAAKLGATRIRQELQGKGLDPQAVADAVTRLRASEFERAQEVWRKKFGTAAPDAIARAKQMRFLASRGFGGDIIRRVVASTTAEEFD